MVKLSAFSPCCAREHTRSRELPSRAPGEQLVCVYSLAREPRVKQLRVEAGVSPFTHTF